MNKAAYYYLISILISMLAIVMSAALFFLALDLRGYNIGVNIVIACCAVVVGLYGQWLAAKYRSNIERM